MKNKLIIKNREAQIGTTLTWFAAFFLIFFIIVLFLSASVLTSERKSVTKGFDTISLQEYTGNLEMQRNLFNIFNIKIEIDGKEARFKDVLVGIEMYSLDTNKKSELITKIKKQTENLLKDSLTADCYIFHAVYGIDPDKITLSDSRGGSYVTGFIEKSTFEFSSSSDTSSPYSGYVKKQQDKWLQSASQITLVRDTTINVFGVDEKKNQVIKIKFYSGKCL